MGSTPNDFSVVILPSDGGIDSRPLLSDKDKEPEDADHWHDCSQNLSSDEDFSDLDLLQFVRLEGSDKAGNRILRVVGKYFPAVVVSGERLKRYIFHKFQNELSEGPFCIVYFHTTAQKDDNCPGLTILRWIYEELPSDYKDRLQFLYFVHPGLRSRLVLATFGRFFLSGGNFHRFLVNILYWKIKYVSRLQYLSEDIKKGEVEIPDFVKSHDEVLEHRPLTDYGIEPDSLNVTEVPYSANSVWRYEERWMSRQYMT
ncbi:hypothetical protein IC582_008982 [Cucumis melo]